MRRLIALLLLVGCGSSPDTPDRPPTADRAGRYLGRTIAPTMDATDAEQLVRPERARDEATETLYSALGLSPGMTVCDVGAGNGFHSLELARRVYPGGRVYATDISTAMLDALAERASTAQAMGGAMVRIERVEGTPTEARLPEGGCDLILLVDAYHEFGHPPEMLAELRRALPLDGRLAVVEYRAEDRALPMPRARRMSKAQLQREFTANGFRLIGQLDALPTQHALFYGRDDGPRAGVALRAWRRREVSAPAVDDGAEIIRENDSGDVE